jgi:hypothetical protein
MGHRFPLSVGFPIAHFVDETFPCFDHASLKLREGMKAQLIDITGRRGTRAAIGLARSKGGRPAQRGA